MPGALLERAAPLPKSRAAGGEAGPRSEALWVPTACLPLHPACPYQRGCCDQLPPRPFEAPLISLFTPQARVLASVPLWGVGHQGHEGPQLVLPCSHHPCPSCAVGLSPSPPSPLCCPQGPPSDLLCPHSPRLLQFSAVCPQVRDAHTSWAGHGVQARPLRREVILPRLPKGWCLAPCVHSGPQPTLSMQSSPGGGRVGEGESLVSPPRCWADPFGTTEPGASLR